MIVFFKKTAMLKLVHVRVFLVLRVFKVVQSSYWLGSFFVTTKSLFRLAFRIHIPLQYTMLMTGTLHGLAFWFDVGFFGST